MLAQNRDIRPFIPAVIEAIKFPEAVPETLHKLSSTVFVQSVDNPALSITVPILLRGCQEKKIESKRRVCVIADNMCKLIDYAHEATTFMPELQPAILRLAEEMSDPEARCVAGRCVKTLSNIQDSAAEFEAAKTMVCVRAYVCGCARVSRDSEMGTLARCVDDRFAREFLIYLLLNLVGARQRRGFDPNTAARHPKFRTRNFFETPWKPNSLELWVACGGRRTP